MALVVAQNCLRVDHVDLRPLLIKRVLDLNQLLQVNLAESPVEHARNGEFGAAIVEPTLHFFKEQILQLIGEDLDSFAEVNVVLRLIVRDGHNEASVDVGVRLHQLIDPLY